MEFKVNNLFSETEIKLVGTEKEPSRRGISQLFSLSSIRKSKSEKIKRVAQVPWIRSKIDAVKSFFSSSSTPSLPTCVSNETAIYEYKPSLYFFSSISAQNDWKANQAPEELVCLGKREKQQTLPSSKQGTIFSNINLELKGRLGRAKDGSILLAITPTLYKQLQTLFHLPHVDEVDFLEEVGPNIAIIDRNEDPKGYITEIGEEYDFTVKRAFEIEPNQWNEAQSVYALEIYCPALEDLRAKYRLQDLPKGQPFHLLLGIKRAPERIENRPDAYFKINVGYHPV